MKKTIKTILWAGLAAGIAFATGALADSWQNFVCETGTVFNDCNGTGDCSGNCDQFVSDGNIADCTASPGNVCNNWEYEGGSGKYYSSGTCASAGEDGNCGCDLPPGATGSTYTQQYTCGA
jgi:hypothetical protein